ncbi:Rho GTPase-activating protein 19, variant 2 [Clonorchis sinensis]|uniref:Rho GTPase-activating protein 19, variant 2 n=1 Tax=Clonorchis sinensis TaxID=79923 RepID=A0A8T1MIY7_CLOSI|nr:Rho GTPase-activating protein 19, variant 2 [Clonorchis sinensis]
MTTARNIVQEYATRLRQSVAEDNIIRDFRDRFSHRFQELCMVHLSFLIDIPWNLFDQRVSSTQDYTPKSALKRLLAGSRVNPQQLKSEAISGTVSDNIINLIELLDTDEVCSTEGIFRKAGHLVRKRQLQEAIFQPSFDTACLLCESYSVHDLAAALKSVLGHLPSPLLTDRLMPLFISVSGLRTMDVRSTFSDTEVLESDPPHSPVSRFRLIEDHQRIDLITGKQLKALRLLVQLLPASNKRVLRRLLRLLSRVVRLESQNRMNSICLGTVFGPVLFPQGMDQDIITKTSRVVASECPERCKRLAALTTVLIDAGLDIFLLPRSLAEDVHANSTVFLDHSQMCPKDPHTTSLSSTSASPRGFPYPSFAQDSSLRSTSSDHSPPLVTGIRFATPTVAGTSICGSHQASPQLTSPSPISTNLISDSSKTSSARCKLVPPFGLETSGSTPRGERYRAPEVTKFHPQNVTLSTLVTDPVLLPCHIPRAERVSNWQKKPSTLLARRSSLSVIPLKSLNTVSGRDLSPIKPSISVAPLESPSKFKPIKRRRYTELKLPGTSHRKNIFSPCPPLKFLPFRRPVPDKRITESIDLNSHLMEAHALSSLTTW